jgi:hypothetical protein
VDDTGVSEERRDAAGRRPQIEKDDPQPQDELAFGFLTRK